MGRVENFALAEHAYYSITRRTYYYEGGVVEKQTPVLYDRIRIVI